MSAPCFHARTNWFRVRDVAALRVALDDLNDDDRWAGGHVELNEDRSGRVSLYPDTESGWFPEFYDDETEEGRDISSVIAPHLSGTEIAVVIEAGGDTRNAGVGGWAYAFDHRGGRVETDLRQAIAAQVKALGASEVDWDGTW
jgi:hypothetical protein